MTDPDPGPRDEQLEAVAAVLRNVDRRLAAEAEAKAKNQRGAKNGAA